MSAIPRIDVLLVTTSLIIAAYIIHTVSSNGVISDIEINILNKCRQQLLLSQEREVPVCRQIANFHDCLDFFNTDLDNQLMLHEETQRSHSTIRRRRRQADTLRRGNSTSPNMGAIFMEKRLNASDLYAELCEETRRQCISEVFERWQHLMDDPVELIQMCTSHHFKCKYDVLQCTTYPNHLHSKLFTNPGDYPRSMHGKLCQARNKLETCCANRKRYNCSLAQRVGEFKLHELDAFMAENRFTEICGTNAGSSMSRLSIITTAVLLLLLYALT